MNSELVPLLLMFLVSLLTNVILLNQRNKNLKQSQKYEENFQECLERLEAQIRYNQLNLKEIVKIKKKEN